MTPWRTRSALVRQEFWDQAYDFRLGIAELEELQERCADPDGRAASPPAVLRRILAGDWRVQDLRETLRLGLIGGGLDRGAALKLVGRAVQPGNLLPCVAAAAVVLQAALTGVEDEPLGEPEAEGRTGETPTRPGPSPDSTAFARN